MKDRQDLKSIPLIDLINKLQLEEQSVLQRFRNITHEFATKTIDSLSIEELETYLTTFRDLEFELLDYYNAFFAYYLKSTVHSEQEKIKLYIDYVSVFINRINVVYINTITYKINDINNRVNLKIARRSIFVGWLSIIIASVIAVGTFILTKQDSERTMLELKNISTQIDQGSQTPKEGGN